MHAMQHEVAQRMLLVLDSHAVARGRQAGRSTCEARFDVQCIPIRGLAPAEHLVQWMPVGCRASRP